MTPETWKQLSSSQKSRYLKKHWEEIPFNRLSKTEQFTAKSHMFQSKLNSIMIGSLYLLAVPFALSIAAFALVFLFGLATT